MTTALTPTASRTPAIHTRRDRTRARFAITRPALGRTLSLAVGAAAVATALALGLSGPAISPVDPAVLGPAPGTVALPSDAGGAVDAPGVSGEGTRADGFDRGGHRGGRGDR